MTDLRTLALAATPGPWEARPVFTPLANLDWPAAVSRYGDETRRILVAQAETDDAAFIAAASPAVVLALLDVVDAARGLVDVVEPADIPTLSREQLDAFLALRAALAAWEEGK